MSLANAGGCWTRRAIGNGKSSRRYASLFIRFYRVGNGKPLDECSFPVNNIFRMDGGCCVYAW